MKNKILKNKIKELREKEIPVSLNREQKRKLIFKKGKKKNEN